MFISRDSFRFITQFILMFKVQSCTILSLPICHRYTSIFLNPLSYNVELPLGDGNYGLDLKENEKV